MFASSLSTRFVSSSCELNYQETIVRKIFLTQAKFSGYQAVEPNKSHQQSVQDRPWSVTPMTGDAHAKKQNSRRHVCYLGSHIYKWLKWPNQVFWLEIPFYIFYRREDSIRLAPWKALVHANWPWTLTMALPNERQQRSYDSRNFLTFPFAFLRSEIKFWSPLACDAILKSKGKG